MEKNIKYVMSKADKGFAEKIPDGEKYIGILAYAEELGYTVFRCKKNGRSGSVVFDGNKCVFFVGPEPFLADIRYSRHNDKYETKELLNSIGVKVPKGQKFAPKSEEEIVGWFQKNNLEQVVLKPTNLNKGKGVFVGIDSADDLRNKYSQISKYPCILEERLQGDEHRFFVVGGRVVAVSKRMPANVTGDGENSIKKLIEEKNIIRSRSRAHRNMMIKFD